MPIETGLSSDLRSQAKLNTMKRIVLRAAADADQWAIGLLYRDSKNNITKRYVSPIRFVASDRFLALCLCREEPRQFYLDRCEAIELVPAANLLMPMAIA